MEDNIKTAAEVARRVVDEGIMEQKIEYGFEIDYDEDKEGIKTSI